MTTQRQLLTTLLAGLILGLGPQHNALPTPQDPETGSVTEANGAAREPMTNRRLGQLLETLDPNLKGEPGNWVLTIQDVNAFVITDSNADRMRILIPITDATDLSQEQLVRIMQANFESALDARYAIAQDTLWSAYIHPLSPLTSTQLISAIAQTYNAAATFGESYSSGMFMYGGGDNRDDVYDEIIERGSGA